MLSERLALCIHQVVSNRTSRKIKVGVVTAMLLFATNQTPESIMDGIYGIPWRRQSYSHPLQDWEKSFPVSVPAVNISIKKTLQLVIQGRLKDEQTAPFTA
jgi:hypothetical protein